MKIPYGGEYEIELWSDMIGMVSRNRFDAPTAYVPTDGVGQPGVYYMRLIIDGEVKATEKVIIR